MNTFIRKNASFLAPYIILFILAGFGILSSNKAELHLWLNGYHTDFLDTFFRCVTKLGEAIPYLIAVLLLFHKVGQGLFVLIGQLSSGLLTQILKHIFNEPRPLRYFTDNMLDISSILVDGVTMRSWFSFPSGHTTAIFALFFSLTLLTRNNTLKFMYLLLAILGGYSRIYLSQHFAIDVWVGSMIGTLVICGFYYSKFPLEKSWGEKSLQDICMSKKETK